MTRIGNYWVARGDELKIQEAFRDYRFYVIDPTGKVIGCFEHVTTAETAARGFEKSDLKQLDDEMHKVLLGK